MNWTMYIGSAVVSALGLAAGYVSVTGSEQVQPVATTAMQNEPFLIEVVLANWNPLSCRSHFEIEVSAVVPGGATVSRVRRCSLRSGKERLLSFVLPVSRWRDAKEVKITVLRKCMMPEVMTWHDEQGAPFTMTHGRGYAWLEDQSATVALARGVPATATFTSVKGDEVFDDMKLTLDLEEEPK